MVPFTPIHSRGNGVAERAIAGALADADLDVELVDQAVASHVYGGSRAGESALVRAGLAGIAISNVSNGAASGSSALFHARQALLAGEAECAIAVGFEEEPESATARVDLVRLCGAQFEWMADHMGIGEETFARVAIKAHAHAAGNAYAIHREPLSIEDVIGAPVVSGRLRHWHVSEASYGAAAVILCTSRFAARHGLRHDILVAAHALEGQGPADSPDLLDALGRAATRHVAERAYESAGIDPADIDVAEVHDCCVSNELISCAALGLCPEDGIERFVLSGANTYGGKVVVSPSGGLLAKGNPPGATGLAQICELTWQLRGDAGPRQVAGARTALQHNGGLGGAVAVTLLQRSH
jgi:acetyl-CoA acetyltransferase